tara:strand:+ start:1084 stop:1365 length:282 start_codon:yes stop_codon:yes gene_type:complete
MPKDYKPGDGLPDSMRRYGATQIRLMMASGRLPQIMDLDALRFLTEEDQKEQDLRAAAEAHLLRLAKSSTNAAWASAGLALIALIISVGALFK